MTGEPGSERRPPVAAGVRRSGVDGGVAAGRRLIAAWRSNTTRNIGDRCASPALYFDWLADAERLDLWEDSVTDRIASRENAAVIVGGGCLVAFSQGPHRGTREVTFDINLRNLSRLGLQNVIVWGAGHQGLDIRYLVYPRYLGRFSLVGVRDWLYNLSNPRVPGWYNWVPCASALHSTFDRTRDKKHEVVIYDHESYPVKISDPGIPRLDHTADDLDDVVDFLGSAELVITSSFHGAYWGTLAGARVVVAEPFATKFLTMRHQPAIAYDIQRWRDVARTAVTHPGALRECRAANHAFAERVLDRLGIGGHDCAQRVPASVAQGRTERTLL